MWMWMGRKDGLYQSPWSVAAGKDGAVASTVAMHVVVGMCPGTGSKSTRLPGGHVVAWDVQKAPRVEEYDSAAAAAVVAVAVPALAAAAADVAANDDSASRDCWNRQYRQAAEQWSPTLQR